MRENKYKLVNWEEGMNVNFNHLQQSENFFLERLCDGQAIRLHGYNYGFLPSLSKGSESTEFEISERITGKVEIKLKRCNAITVDGYRISYNPVSSDCMLHIHSFADDKKAASSKQVWDVILVADPFRRVPTGIPDEKETPPRHPDSAEHYNIAVVPQGHINSEQMGLHYLLIGRIRQKGGRYEIDSNYIPPCTSMRSHSDLLKYYENFGVSLNNIEKASNTIISKVRNRSQNSPLAHHVAMMCENIMRYIATIYFAYRNTGGDAAPIEIVNYFSTLAHVCYISLNFISKQEKEELLKYFYEWSDVTPGSFEELLANTLGIAYEHNGIRTMMLQLESFLQILAELWLKLSKLEYIGQHKDNIVVSERSYQQDVPKRSGGWTILD